MELMATILIFLSIASAVLLAGRLLAKNTPQKPPENLLFRPATFGSFNRPLAGIVPHSKKKRERLSKELVSAGLYHQTALDNFLAQRNLALVLVLLTIAFMFAGGVADGHEIVVSAIGGAVLLLVYALPRLVLTSKANRRLQEIEKAMPDALDMMAMSMAGGLSLQRSLETVAQQLQQTHVALGRELQIITRQSRRGSLTQAFSSFEQRLDLPEVVAWSSLMRQSQKLGGKLVQSLSEYANRIREDRKRRAERAGNTASIKLLLPVVLCLAPPIFILLVGPAILDLREFMNREKGGGAELIQQTNEFLER